MRRPLPLRWTPSALSDLQEIREFIRRDKIEKLRHFPFIGRRLKTIPGTHEIILFPYHIFYRPAASEVQILRILHGKREIAFVA